MKDGFVREVYLRSTPSVDLELVTEQVDCCQHTIPMSVYNELLAEYCENADERLAANMFMLMSGPQLIEG
jgi:hypothetical protein